VKFTSENLTEDSFTSRISIPELFIGNTATNSLYINVDGYVSFDTAAKSLPTNIDSLGIDTKLIAAYWDDLTLSTDSSIQYFIINDSTSPEMQSVNNLLTTTLNSANFNASWLFVVQWINLCIYSPLSSSCSLADSNTFQLVLASSSQLSTAIITYRCGQLNTKRRGPIVGYKTDEIFWEQHPLSNSEGILNLDCANEPNSPWTNIVYYLNRVGPVTKLISLPITIVFPDSQSVNISCLIMSNPMPTVVWLEDGINLSSSSSKSVSIRKIKPFNYISVLSLLNDTWKANGQYSCQARNDFNAQSTSEPTTIRNIEPVRFITEATKPSPSSSVVSLGSELEIRARVSSIPRPAAYWVGPRNQTLTNSSHFTIYETHRELDTGWSRLHCTLKLSNITYKHSGVYRFIASSPISADGTTTSISEAFSIYVEGPPAFDLLSNPLNAQIMESYQLSFAVLNDISAHIDYSAIQWTFTNANGTTYNISCTSNCSFSMDRLTLIIHNVTLANKGDYTISLINSFGVGTKTVPLLVTAPAVLVDHPTDVTSLEGGHVTVTCTSHGYPLPNVMWYRDGRIPLTGYNITNVNHQLPSGLYVISSSLSLYNISSTNNGSYFCETSDDIAIVDILVQSQPKLEISTNQSSVLAAGNSLYITCTGTAYPVPSLTIYRNNIPLYSNDRVSVAFTGMGTQSVLRLTIDEVVPADEGEYSCNAVNGLVQILSVNITREFEIFDGVNILSKPSFMVFNETSMSVAVINCTAIGYPTPHLTWMKTALNGSDIPLTNHHNIMTKIRDSARFENGSYKIVSSLIISNISKNDEGFYHCQADNSITGSDFYSTSSVRFNISVQTAPSVVFINESFVVVLRHQNISIVAIIISELPIRSIEWYHRDLLIHRSYNYQITDDDKLTLNIPNIQFNDSGIYTVAVTNDLGSRNSSLTIDVQGLPFITNRLVSQYVLSGQNVTFSYDVTSNPSFDVSWLVNDRKLLQNERVLIMTTHNSTTLSIANVILSDAGNITCIVSNIHGNRSKTVELNIQVPVTDVHIDSPSVVTVNISNSINVSCSARGYPLPVISWWRSNHTHRLPLAPVNGKLTISSTSLRKDYVKSYLSFDFVSLSDAGSYYCSAYNDLVGYSERSSKNISLDVIIFPRITQVSDDVVSVLNGHIAVLKCTYESYPWSLPQWLFNGSILTNGTKYVIDHDNNSLYISNASVRDGGVYTCRVSNAYGRDMASITLEIKVPPQISPNYQRLQVLHTFPIQNISIRFNLTRIGRPSILLDHVHWTFTSNNSTIPVISDRYQMYLEEAGYVQLDIIGIKYTDSGIYKVSITHPAGNVSAVAVVSINVPLAVKIIGQRVVYINESDQVNITCITDGVPGPTKIFWFRDGTLLEPKRISKIRVVNLPSNGYREGMTDGVDGLMSTLVLSDSTRSDRGRYNCHVTNEIDDVAQLDEPVILNVIPAPIPDFCKDSPCQNGGTCFSNNATCNCPLNYVGIYCEKFSEKLEPPTIVTNPANTTGDLYSSVVLRCEVSGNPQPMVEWYKDGQPIFDDDGNQYTYIIRQLELENRGFYTCTATNFINEERHDKSSYSAVVNINGIIQYQMSLYLSPLYLTNKTEEAQTDVLKEHVANTNLVITGTILSSDTELFLLQLQPNARYNFSSHSFPVLITVITQERGSLDLLNFVREQLFNISGISFNPDGSFNRFDGCEKATTIIPPPSGGSINVEIEWKETNIGEYETVECPCGEGVDLGGGALFARIFCGGSFESGSKWEMEDVTACNFSNRAREICKLANLPPNERVERLADVAKEVDSFTPTDVSIVASVLISAEKGVAGNRNGSENVYNVIDNIANLDESTLRETQKLSNTPKRLLNNLEKITTNLPIPNDTDVVFSNKGAFNIENRRVRSNDFNGVHFNGGDLNSNRSLFASVVIPSTFLNETTETSGSFFISNIYHKRSSLFVDLSDESRQVSTAVISATLTSNGTEISVEDLNEPIQINLEGIPVNDDDVNVIITCVYWNITTSQWRSDGCQLVNGSNSTMITCECDHLTNFAAILDVAPVELNYTTPVGIALDALSYIGNVVSIICLGVTIFTYLYSKKLRKSDHGQLLLNLCFSLLGIYIFYILGVHTTSVGPLCAIVGALLQYFMLVTFFSMAAEAINLYMKLVVVLGKGIRRYVLKVILVSWVVPIFIVVFCFAPDYTQYIGAHFCRPYDIPFYIGTLVPFCAIYVFNWVLFIIIMVQLIKKRFEKKFAESHTKESNVSFMQQFMIALTLSILFGLGWGVGLLSVGQLYTVPAVRDLFSALFILLTGFQGLFIFIMHCVKSPEARKVWKRLLYKLIRKKELNSNLSSVYYQKPSQRTSSSYISSIREIKKSKAEESEISCGDDSLPPIAVKTPPVSPIHSSSSMDVSYELPNVQLEKAKELFPSTTSFSSRKNSCGTCTNYDNPFFTPPESETEDSNILDQLPLSPAANSIGNAFITQHHLGNPMMSSDSIDCGIINKED
jgi:hypothetical protein